MSYTYEKSSYGLLAKGDYEVKLEGIKFVTTTNGKEKMSLMFQVREDVEQDGKKRTLFDDIWKEKDAPQYFNRKRINNILGTQEIKEGQQFNDINDIVEVIKDCKLIAHVVVEYNDYKGEEVNRIAYYKTSLHKTKGLEEEEGESDALDIASDDLPF